MAEKIEKTKIEATVAKPAAAKTEEIKVETTIAKPAAAKTEEIKVETTIAKPAAAKTEETKVETTTTKPAGVRTERTYSRPSRPPQDRNNRRRTFKPRGKFLFKKKVCFFCKNKNAVIDYKDVGLLKRFIAESGKITPRRFTGACTKHQRKIAVEIKKARQMALLQYTDKHKY